MSYPDDIKTNPWRNGEPEDLLPAYAATTPSSATVDRVDNETQSSSSNLSGLQSPAGGTTSQSEPQSYPSAQPHTPYSPLTSYAPISTLSRSYALSGGIWSTDKTSITSTLPDLLKSPIQLVAELQRQIALPPKPVLRIIGVHHDSIGKEIKDFDLTLNLMTLLKLSSYEVKVEMPKDGPQNGIFRNTRTRHLRDENSKPIPREIREIVSQFLAERAEPKSLVLTRHVEGLAVEALAGQVRNLAAAIKYRGRISMALAEHWREAVIKKESSGLIGGFFSKLGLVPEKRLKVIDVYWKFGYNDGDAVEKRISSQEGAMITQEWWREWQTVIRNAMISKRQGNLSIDDWMESNLASMVYECPKVEWGVDQAI